VHSTHSYEASGFAAIEDERDGLDAALESMQVKARVTFWCCMGRIEDRGNEGCDIQFAMSVVKDLLRMQGIWPTTHDHECAATTIARLLEVARFFNGLLGSAP
jgi:hypothetical protein